jgi:hypothetical protein
MSKKHFEALAAKIKNYRNEIRACGSVATDNEIAVALASVEHIARDLADVCADANPRFDTRLFLTACGIN